MSFGLRALFGVLLVSAPLAWAESSDERYVLIYNLIQDADAAVSGGQTAMARDRYREARDALEKLRAALPGWNEAVIQYRLKYVSEKLERLESNELATPVSAEPKGVVAPADVAESAVKGLKDQIDQLARDRSLLELKLKEALAAQPANVDSREIARSEDTVKSLQKELEVLRVRLNEAEAKPDRPVSSARFQEVMKDLDDAQQRVSELEQAISSLSLEKKALQTRLLATEAGTEFKTLSEENLLLKRQLEQFSRRVESTAGLEQVVARFGSLQKELRDLQARNEILEAEKRILEQRAGQLEKRRDTDVAEATRELAKALTDARSAVQAGNAAAAELQNSIREAHEARDRIGREKAEMEAQLSSVRSALATERLARIASDEAARKSADELLRTQRERDQLKAQVSLVSEELGATQTRLQKAESLGPAGRGADLNVALVSARRGVGQDIHGQASVPSGPGAIVPGAAPAGPRTAVASTTRPGVGPKPVESAVNLAHLAAIQMDQARLAEAELTLKAALAKDPANIMCLLMLGQLRVRQGNFAEAVEPLSRAVQSDPQNPEACNFLGVALMEKGLREPAEFALRRSLRLSPNYGEAHYNLAVFYLRQRPPALEKASEHYQRSLASGHAADIRLEAELKRGSTTYGAR